MTTSPHDVLTSSKTSPTGPRTRHSPLSTRSSRRTGPPSSPHPPCASSPSGHVRVPARARAALRRHMRAVVLIHRHGKGPYAAVSSVIKARFRTCRRARKRGHMAIFASFSYFDRGDCWVVYGVIVAFRRPPRGVVSRGQVQTRFRLPLSPAAFLDRLEKGIKRKIFCCNTSPSSTGPKTLLRLSVP